MSVVGSGSSAHPCARAVATVNAMTTIAPTSTSVHRLLMTVSSLPRGSRSRVRRLMFLARAPNRLATFVDRSAAHCARLIERQLQPAFARVYHHLQLQKRLRLVLDKQLAR